MDSPILIFHINLLKNHSRLKIQNKRVDHKSFIVIALAFFLGEKSPKGEKL
jgi:hypothetical protein